MSTNNDEYHADTEYWTCSMAKTFAHSRREAYETYITGRIPKKESNQSMQVGTVGHAVLLENKNIGDVCVSFPPSCFSADGKLVAGRRDKFISDNPDKIAIRESDMLDLRKIIDNARRSPLGEALAAGCVCEKRLNGEISGLKAKCKPDALAVPSDGVLRIYDLKFMKDISPKAFERSARNFKYYLQHSWYGMIAVQNYKCEAVMFQFFSLETTFPFRIHRYEFDARSVELAIEYAKLIAGQIKECLGSGDWSDKWTNTLVLNRWDVGIDDNDDMEVEFE